MSRIPLLYNSTSISGLLVTSLPFSQSSWRMNTINLILQTGKSDAQRNAAQWKYNVSHLCKLKPPRIHIREGDRTIKINCDNTFYLIRCIQNIITLTWDHYKKYFKMIHKVPCVLCAKALKSHVPTGLASLD